VNAEWILFELELRRGADPIEGRLRDEHGSTVFFGGWLELIAILERAKTSGSYIPADEDNIEF
jgi:hypothetical protein